MQVTLNMLQASYFDGCSTRVRAVNLSVVGDDLVVAGEDVDLVVPFADVTVDERLGRAPRRLRMKDGAFCEVRDLHALDALLSSTPHRDGRVDRMQRHLQTILLSGVARAVFGRQHPPAEQNHRRTPADTQCQISCAAAPEGRHFLTFYLGDISALLAAAPAAVVQAKYSQDLERQADEYGAALLMNNGMSPALLADALKKLAKSHPGSAQAGYLASHPSTDERMLLLRELAAAFTAQ